MKLLFTLLRRNVSPGQLVGFSIGGILGAVILLLSLQTYCNVSQAFTAGNDIFSARYVVLSKPVGLLNTLQGLLGNGAPTFSEKEVTDLQSVPGVEQVASFRSAHFTVDAVIRMGGHTLGTELFLESVPDEFVDVPTGGTPWKASLSDDFVPVLVPRNYLDLYNFGYAASRGLPQLSEGAISQFSFRLRVGAKYYQARIVGFTTRLNTILVPDAFLAEANRRYAQKQPERPARLVIRTAEGAPTSDLLQYIERQHYEVADQGDAQVRMQSFVYAVVWAVASVGALVSLLAFFLLFFSLTLLIERNKNIFRNLASMGFSLSEMSRPYRLLALTIDLSVWGVAALISCALYPYLGSIIRLAAPQSGTLSIVPLFLFALLFALLFIVLHLTLVQRAISRCLLS